MELIESKTLNNLAKAYAGECQARTRYEFMEYGARKQGYACLAEIIDKVAYNEFNHARMFYTYIQQASDKLIDNIDICGGYPFKEKWDVQENLRIASEDEHLEAYDIYPQFAQTAKEEGFKEIEQLFLMVADVEKCHSMLFGQLYEQMKKGTLYKRKTAIKWKCAGCGYEGTTKQAPDECPLCKAKQGFFMLHIEDGSDQPAK